MPLQPDVTGLLLDRALGAVPFTIIRTTVTWERGRIVPMSSTIACIGNIQPATPRELQQLPEGDHMHGVIVIRSPNTIYTSNEEFAPTAEQLEQGATRASDEIEWRGSRYKVLSAMPWMDYGWVEAFATKKG